MSWGLVIETGGGPLPLDDHIAGDAGNAIIESTGGNDEIYGGQGNDFISGDAGIGLRGSGAKGDLDPDIVKGVGGDDLLYGGTGNDRLFGDAADDVAAGSRGGDDEIQIRGVGAQGLGQLPFGELVVEAALVADVQHLR